MKAVKINPWFRRDIFFTRKIAIFSATLAPVLIWPLSNNALARPSATFIWFILCAFFFASAPGRFARFFAWILMVALPWTIGWLGTVAVTGLGPSNAVMASITAGAFREVIEGMKLAIVMPSFLVVVLLTAGCTIWAFLVTKDASKNIGNVEGLIFLLFFGVCSITLIDGAGYRSLSKLVGPEARISVTWFSHAGVVKENIFSLANNAIVGDANKVEILRSASAARKSFDIENGLGVFIIGDSLRPDALVNENRGSWSRALKARIQNGLGVRLPDVCAAANGTFGAVPRLLTAVDIVDLNGAASKPTLLALAKAAGAKTAYINNHEVWVVPETGHDVLHKTSSMGVSSFDEVAVDVLDDFVERSGSGPKAAVLHLYGQHFPYEDRYPQDMFDDEPSNLQADELLELRYHRAVEYGIRVLMMTAEILDKQTTPAFLVFTSDHGENLPSDNTGKYFHALPVSGRNEVTVPALVLWNKAFLMTGKIKRLDKLLRANGLIAHRDVARAWLVLEGLSDDLIPDSNPMTWGAREPGDLVGAIPCSTLNP